MTEHPMQPVELRPDLAEPRVKKWKCDRCGVELDAAPALALPYYSLSMGESAIDCSRNIIEWKELCGGCNAYVCDLWTKLKKENAR